MQPGSSVPFAAALLAALPLTAQAPIPAAGYGATLWYRESSGPYSFRGAAVDLLGWDLYGAIDSRVVRIDQQQQVHDLLVLPVGQTIGLVVRPSRAVEVFFTHFEQRRLYRRHLYSQVQTSGPVPHQAFDLELAPGGELLVSANPTWPAPGNRAGIWLVDGAQGNHREIAQLAGPCGPLLLTPGGELLYALQSSTYPTPPGSVKVIRFAAAAVAAALAGTRVLTLADARDLLVGLDGAYDLELDDRGRLYVSDPQHGDVIRTLPDLGARDPVPFVARPEPPLTRGTLQLSFLDFAAAPFDPWQPPASGVLYVASSDWQLASRVDRIRAQRPALELQPGPVLPPGPVRIATSQAPPRAPALLLASGHPPVADWSPFALGGTPLWLGIAPLAPLATMPGTSDAAGALRFDLVHPGGFAATVTAQIVLVDLGALRVASTPALALQLLP